MKESKKKQTVSQRARELQEHIKEVKDTGKGRDTPKRKPGRLLGSQGSEAESKPGVSQAVLPSE